MSLSTLLLRRRATVRALSIAMFAAVAACDSSDTNSPSLVATTVSASVGIDGQSATVGSTPVSGTSVLVFDQNGTALSNATVTWTVTSGAGTVSSATSTTDANGLASITWTLGTASGANTLVASLAGGASVTITATGVAGAVSTLTVVSGADQSISAGSSTDALIVKAADQYGNAITGQSIDWTTSGGTLNGTPTASDTNGQSSNTLSTTDAGVYVVTATAGSVSAQFTVTAN